MGLYEIQEVAKKKNKKRRVYMYLYMCTYVYVYVYVIASHVWKYLKNINP